MRGTLLSRTSFFGSFINFPRPEAAGDEDFDDLTPRFVARYELSDDLSVYGTVSKGYKAGGSSVGNNTNQPGNPAFTVKFDEETLWNYELGFKSELLDNRVRLNGSVFYLEWSDLQMEAFRFLTPGDLSSNFEQTINIEDAEATGVELELLAAVTDEFTLSGAIGYLDTEITSDTQAEITGGFVVDLEGLELPKAPELSANLAGEYRVPLTIAGCDCEGWVRLEYVHLALETLGRGVGRYLSYGNYPQAESQFLRSGVWDGKLHALDAQAIAEDVSHAWLEGETRHPAQGVTRPQDEKAEGYTWCKAPRLAGLPMETGALARQVVNGHPLARDLVRHGGATSGAASSPACWRSP